MRRPTIKIISLFLCFCFLLEQAGLAQAAAAELNLPGYLAKMGSSLPPIDTFRPIHLRYFSYDSLNNNFKVLLDKGDLRSLKEEDVQDEAKSLLKYFLIGVTLNDDKFWVNLRPDSPSQIIDSVLEQTDMGKVMLEADLKLKKDIAHFTSPQTPEGKEYWGKLCKKAEELYGTDAVTIPTITRPWIVPNEIIVRETEDSAYIYKATLKVMLEQDYLRRGQSSSNGIQNPTQYEFKDERSKALNEYSTQLIRELIIPKLTKEVNTSKVYAPLRQVFYSLVMARWFKSKFRGKPGTYPALIDKQNLNNLTSQESWSKDTYFNAYKRSFAEGEYNIKEPVYTPTGQVIRSYFSGGIGWAGSTAIDTEVGYRTKSPLSGRVLKRARMVGYSGDVSVRGLVFKSWQPSFVSPTTSSPFNPTSSAATSPLVISSKELEQWTLEDIYPILRENMISRSNVIEPEEYLRKEIMQYIYDGFFDIWQEDCMAGKEYFSGKSHKAWEIRWKDLSQFINSLAEGIKAWKNQIGLLPRGIKPSEEQKKVSFKIYMAAVKQALPEEVKYRELLIIIAKLLFEDLETLEKMEKAARIIDEAFKDTMEGVVKASANQSFKETIYPRIAEEVAEAMKEDPSTAVESEEAKAKLLAWLNELDKNLIYPDGLVEILKATRQIIGDDRLKGYPIKSLEYYSAVKDLFLGKYKYFETSKPLIDMILKLRPILPESKEFALKVLSHLWQALDREGVVRAGSSAGSPVGVAHPGGIDFRSKAMAGSTVYQPMGSFKGLNFTLPILSKEELDGMNTAQEIQNLKNMIFANMRVSGDRLKRLVAACVQKGEITASMDDLIVCAVDMCEVEESEFCLEESSPELRETLVILDSGLLS